LNERRPDYGSQETYKAQSGVVYSTYRFNHITFAIHQLVLHPLSLPCISSSPHSWSALRSLCLPLFPTRIPSRSNKSLLERSTSPALFNWQRPTANMLMLVPLCLPMSKLPLLLLSRVPLLPIRKTFVATQIRQRLKEDIDANGSLV
jgi:hypothetical protein